MACWRVRLRSAHLPAEGGTVADDASEGVAEGDAVVNLIPLCSKHHHAAHEGGWQLTLHPDRALTIVYPDGTTQTTGPPGRLGSRGTQPNEPVFRESG